MLKVTKKEVKEFLKECRGDNPFGWKLWRCGAFIYNNKVNLFVAYHGQGLNEVIYNESYDDIVEFEDLCDTYEYNLKNATNIVHEQIKDMIENYLEK
ncbi:hypothetical protein CF086_17055 [Clostridium botulinum]|uniref:hypothetical protein n=1 Tax=Clostridium botulinum TaxID=1491 RepID=UPI00077465E5|nr:hypothetical protein [Clostridium botulinum]MBN3352005.1 hypothetical protein [Clostridium botulinum]